MCKASRDLNGAKYNKLTIVKEAQSKRDDWGIYPMVECICDCGNIVNLRLSAVVTGQTRSCGCLRGAPVEDITGKKYGLLTVLREVEPHEDYKGTKRHMVECRCDCGNTKITQKRYLKSGSVKSCGCLPHGVPKKDLTGKTYGYLTVIGSGTKKGTRLFRCICGNEKEILLASVKNGQTKSCGCYAKIVQRQPRKRKGN